MNSYPRLLLIAFVAWRLVYQSSAVAASAEDVELGKQFLYCGVVTMKVIEWTGQQGTSKEVVEKRSKAAYTRMLIQTAPLIPKNQLNIEYRAAQSRLAEELRAKAAERASDPLAVGAFLKEQYLACQKLESEKGKEAFARGVEHMTKPGSASPQQ